MDEEERQHFELLRQGEFIPGDYVRDYYGLAWPLAEDTEPAFNQYRQTLPRRAESPKEFISRYELEGYMSRADVLPRKWMAARLGMRESSLDELLDKLGNLGMHQQRYAVSSEFVAGSLAEDLIRFVNGLRFRTFHDHNAYCDRLHEELKNELRIEIEKLYCDTSDRMGEEPRRYAMYFDCLTLRPLSTKHSLWLEFSKPIRLPPDRCSKLFYVENRTDLKEHLSGPTEPEGLEEYEKFLAGVRND